MSLPQQADIVLVCHANVCRSPLAAFTLMTHTSPLGWHVVSRGTHTRGTPPLCSLVAERIGCAPAGDDFITSFSAHRLTEADAHAPLILTASSAEKSVVARLAPDSRRRTFTLLEATMLLTLTADTAPPTAQGPHAVAAHLHDVRRGSAAALRPPTYAADIPDGHGRRRRAHRATLDATAATATRLATLLGL